MIPALGLAKLYTNTLMCTLNARSPTLGGGLTQPSRPTGSGGRAELAKSGTWNVKTANGNNLSAADIKFQQSTTSTSTKVMISRETVTDVDSMPMDEITKVCTSSYLSLSLRYTDLSPSLSTTPTQASSTTTATRKSNFLRPTHSSSKSTPYPEQTLILTHARFHLGANRQGLSFTFLKTHTISPERRRQCFFFVIIIDCFV